ncbi:hypothetical protein CGRA01v4_06732 [Colletotrichum graminicola]|nr:hypothetical protein CGRA01v4_06732 [Colletotrichum graminicola]
MFSLLIKVTRAVPSPSRRLGASARRIPMESRYK